MKKLLTFLVLIVACFSGLAADLNSGLVAYYPFNGNANDESGNWNNGIVNGATLSTDRFGNENSAYDFSGDDFIYIEGSSLLNIEDYISIVGWFKIGIGFSDMDGIVDRGPGLGEHGGYYVRIRNMGIDFALSLPYTEFYNNNTLEENRWYFFSTTYDNNKIKIYVNDALIRDQVIGEDRLDLWNNDDPLRIGIEGDDHYFNGKIDDIRIYNRALSTEEIQELYHQGGWPFLTEFTAEPRFGSYPLEVNFSDVSENSTSWEWDFQNDGIIDSYEQNPTFVYNEAGIYDVKLKTTFGAVVDSLVKTSYIVIQESQLNAPQNPIITKSGNDIILNWDSVTDADYYLIYKSDNPYNDFKYLDYTTATSYIHSNVVLQESNQFYIIIGFDGTIERLTEFINQNQKKKLTKR